MLEELLYWLLEEYGLRDLKWRRGGSTTNAGDGGVTLKVSVMAPELAHSSPNAGGSRPKGA